LKSRQPSDWTEVTQGLSSIGGIGVLGVRNSRPLESRNPEEITVVDLRADTRQEIWTSRHLEHRVFQRQETLAYRNRDPRFPDAIRAVNLKDRVQGS
jgi:hypothetical protein